MITYLEIKIACYFIDTRIFGVNHNCRNFNSTGMGQREVNAYHYRCEYHSVIKIARYYMVAIGIHRTTHTRNTV